MIIGKIQIVLHLDQLDIYAYRSKGAHFISFKILYKRNNKYIQANPIVAQTLSQHLQPKPQQFTTNQYYSSIFNTSSLHHQLKEYCKFHLQIPMSQHISLFDIEIQIRAKIFKTVAATYDYQANQVASFSGKIRSPSVIHEYFQIRFTDSIICLLNGSIHSFTYQFMFKSNKYEIKELCNQRQQKFKKTHIRSPQDNIMPKQIQTVEQFFDHHTKFIPALMTQQMRFYSSFVQQEFNQIKKACQIFRPSTKKEQLISRKEPSFICYQRKRKSLFSQKIKTIEISLQDYIKNSTKQQKQQICGNFLKNCNATGAQLYELWDDYINLFLKQWDLNKMKLQKQIHDKYKQEWGQNLISYQQKTHSFSQSKFNSAQDLKMISKNLRSKIKIDPKLLKFVDHKFISHHGSQTIIVHQQNYITQPAQLVTQPKRIFILVHGFQATRSDMYTLRNALKETINCQIMISNSNQNGTSCDIRQMGLKLANQVKFYILDNYKDKQFRLSFVGHSMGGIIIRAAILQLTQYRKNMDMYMSLSSPHIGYMYNSTPIINTAMSLLHSTQNILSLKQLCMQDSPSLEQCFLSMLSRQGTLQPFKRVVLIGSLQDLYVPFQSARIQKGSLSEQQGRQSLKGTTYLGMIRSIFYQIQAKSVHRISVDFNLADVSFDTVIGRAAHIKFINDGIFLRQFVRLFQDLFK